MLTINKKYTSSALNVLKKKCKQNEPFPHVVIPHLFDEKEAEALHSALKAQTFEEKRSDLFLFHQTQDLAYSKNEIIQNFHKTISSKHFFDFIESITGFKPTSVDLFGSKYLDTNFLLPHDDQLEGRKIAYIYYLTKDFLEKDGGTLDLFNSEKNKPTTISESFVPTINTLILFEVSKKSFHQVSEVLSDKERLAIGGWFHD